MTNILLRTSAVLAVATVGLSAQTLLPTGASVGGGDDVLVPVTLPFMFPFPGGTLTDQVMVSTNGWIEADVGQTDSDLSESVAELLGDPPSIRAYWDDLNEPGGAQVFFDTSVAGVATISWVDTIEFGNTGPFTVQAQLSQTGVITIVWDNRVVMPAIDGDCLIGVSAGNGIADPGESDFSSVFGGGAIVATADAAYEQFAAGEFDLADGGMTTGLIFTPTSPGFVITGFVAPPPPEVTVGRFACSSDAVSMTLIPTSPGYIVTPGGTLDNSFANGQVLELTDDAVAATALSFNFTMPGGVVTNAIDLDSNGRLFESGLEFSDFSPSIAEFLGDPTSIIAPLWCDFNPAAGGAVFFHDDGTGTSASYTWNNVPQFNGTDGNSFQARLFSDNSISFHYLDLAINNDEAGTPGLDSQSVVIGVSSGNGAADPGEMDLSTGTPTSTADVLYEFFDELANEFDLGTASTNASLDLIVTTPPAIGANFSVDVVDSDATATGAVYFFGFPTGIFVPTVNLGVLGVPQCEILADILTPGALLASPSGTVGTPTVVFPIPNSTALIGIGGLVVSGLTVNPGQVPLFEPTNEVIITIGG